ncbi:hypothetical protein ACFX2H_021656 [Malus domestica]
MLTKNELEFAACSSEGAGCPARSQSIKLGCTCTDTPTSIKLGCPAQLPSEGASFDLPMEACATCEGKLVGDCCIIWKLG